MITERVRASYNANDDKLILLKEWVLITAVVTAPADDSLHLPQNVKAPTACEPVGASAISVPYRKPKSPHPSFARIIRRTTHTFKASGSIANR